MKTNASSPLRGRAILLLIALTAVVPFLVAWYYAQHPELIEKTSNYGTLVVPVQTLPQDRLLAQPFSDPQRVEEVKGRWVLLQVTHDGCGAVCKDALHRTHQGWLMLNKEMLRVRRVLLVKDAKTASQATIQQDDAVVPAGIDPAVLKTLEAALGGPVPEGAIFLVDPLMNVALWYAPSFDPYQLVKDIKHLLKASQIG
ncbi:MAG: hypothetical protein RL333_241 [Pseudomonadota bacterium]|jgi:hypothetical protein